MDLTHSPKWYIWQIGYYTQEFQQDNMESGFGIFPEANEFEREVGLLDRDITRTISPANSTHKRSKKKNNKISN